ncbi:MAG: DMT family transporter [Cyanobacteria bacterium P01_A01_bin.17]
MSQLLSFWRRISGRVYLGIAVLLFGSASAVTRRLMQIGALHSIDGRNPLSFCNVLLVGNLCALLVLCLVYGRPQLLTAFQRLSGRDYLVLLSVALLAGALAPSLFFIALEQTNVNNVILIGRIEPPLTLALAVIFLKERTNIWIVGGGALAFVGVLLTIILQAHGAEEVMVSMGRFEIGRGELWTLMGAISTAIATVISQIGLRQVPLGLFAIVRTAVGSAIFFLIVLQFFGGNHFADVFTPSVWQWMLIYGAVIVAGGQLCWFQGLKTTSAAEVSLASAFGPIAGFLAAYLILGEPPTVAQWIGGLVIMAGIALNQLGVSRQIAKQGTSVGLQELDLEVGFKGI